MIWAASCGADRVLDLSVGLQWLDMHTALHRSGQAPVMRDDA